MARYVIEHRLLERGDNQFSQKFGIIWGVNVRFNDTEAIRLSKM